jgi:hypothetical protein
MRVVPAAPTLRPLDYAQGSAEELQDALGPPGQSLRRGRAEAGTHWYRQQCRATELLGLRELGVGCAKRRTPQRDGLEVVLEVLNGDNGSIRVWTYRPPHALVATEEAKVVDALGREEGFLSSHKHIYYQHLIRLTHKVHPKIHPQIRSRLIRLGFVAVHTSVLSLKFAYKSERPSLGSGRRICARPEVSGYGYVG